DSLRIEKAYRGWGHDIGGEDTPFEAGLGFAVRLDKRASFTGRDALLARQGKPLTRRLAVFVLDDPDPLLYHDEPIWRDGALVGIDPLDAPESDAPPPGVPPRPQGRQDEAGGEQGPRGSGPVGDF